MRTGGLQCESWTIPVTRVCGCELTLAWGWEDRMTRVLAVLRLEPSSTRPRSVSRVIESSGTSARHERNEKDVQFVRLWWGSTSILVRGEDQCRVGRCEGDVVPGSDVVLQEVWGAGVPAGHADWAAPERDGSDRHLASSAHQGPHSALAQGWPRQRLRDLRGFLWF